MTRLKSLAYVQTALICGATLAGSAAAHAKTTSPAGTCTLSKTEVANILGNPVASRKRFPGQFHTVTRPLLCVYHAATAGGISAVVGRVAPADWPRFHRALGSFGPGAAMPKSLLSARSPEQFLHATCSVKFGVRRATAVHGLGDRACTIHNALYLMSSKAVVFVRVSGTSEAEALNLERDLALAEITAVQSH